ncbi:hypothetical protein GQE99_20540 [Maritimibacter sp. DP07]|uniref:Uncharacterized protein n=1 Tax=Maritimibacter harenae TaxID=2606218 RepID=A0A845M905_9RHOB|nr:hypothetical protein [Maritimibacter harenae]MZR15408.1 hypothetical protein [Maritimibacter harenae]
MAADHTADTQHNISIGLMTGEQLAQAMLFSGASQSFRNWLKRAGIEPVPGRRGIYDPKHVRARLDAIQGLPSDDAKGQGADVVSLVEARRARRGQG